MVACEIPEWEQGTNTWNHMYKILKGFDKHNSTRQHKLVKNDENKLFIVYGQVRAVGIYTQIKLWMYQQFNWSD